MQELCRTSALRLQVNKATCIRTIANRDRFLHAHSLAPSIIAAAGGPVNYVDVMLAAEEGVL